jgi:hypothetical protein
MACALSYVRGGPDQFDTCLVGLATPNWRYPDDEVFHRKNDLHIRNLTPASTILQASHRNMSIRAVLLF